MSLDWLRQPSGGMDRERVALKAKLYAALARPRLVAGRFQFITQCQLCGFVFSPSQIMPALHELVLERDDVQGCSLFVQYQVLHTELNLTLLCNEPCNIKLAKDDQLRQYLLSKQIDRYGAGGIVAWLRSLALPTIDPHIRRIEQLTYDWGPHGDERLNSPGLVRRRKIRDQLVRERLASYGRQPLF